MILRLAGKGRNKGSHFYGCSRFPRCKGTRPYTGEPSEREPSVALSPAAPTNPNGAQKTTVVAPSESPKEKRPLTEQQRKELVKLRDRLLNLSSRNRSIRLNRLDAKWTFDLSTLNPFGIEVANELLQHCLKSQAPKPILPKPKDDPTAELQQKLSLRLTHLHRSITELQREKGLHDLYIGFPFLTGIPLGSETVIQAPVFLLPVTLQKVTPKKGAPSWVLSSSKDMPVAFNKTLFLALSKMCNLTINPSLFEEDIPDELYGATSFIQKTHELLNEYGIRCEVASDASDQEFDRVPEFTMKELPPHLVTGRLEVCQYAVLGHFPQSNSSIQRDYDKFLELDQDSLDSVICFLSSEQMLEAEAMEAAGGGSTMGVQNVEIPGSEFPDDSAFAKTIDDRKESENFLLLPSDSSQDRILLELGDTKNQGLVVWGPPGTGKSQTIVNLIGDCLARGKTVLLVSQKRAALDVVYDRLGLKQLSNLVGLVHDSKADRKPLYEKINGESAQGWNLEGRPESVPIDPSQEIDRIGNTLKDVSRAYNVNSFGVKLGELYRKLGGRKDGLVTIDTEYWKTKLYSDLAPVMMQLRSLQSHVRIESNSALIKHRKPFCNIENHELSVLKSALDSLTVGEQLLEASAMVGLQPGQGSQPSTTTVLISTVRLRDFSDALTLYGCFSGFGRYFKLPYWQTYLRIKKHLTHARSELKRHAAIAHETLHRLLDKSIASKLVGEVLSARHDRNSLREFATTIADHFYELKSYDIALESLSPEVRAVADALDKAVSDGTLARSEDWGTVFERSVFTVWVMEIERRQPVMTLVRSGQIDSLRLQYKELLKKKVDSCIHRLKQRLGFDLLGAEGQKFKREINTDVNKTRNTLSIRKLNEKYIDRDIYRSLIPVWLVSPEVVSDVFPLKQGLFDVVIFDEASQCTVEHGLPAIFRGKQVVIAGDEKQLPPSKLFESSVEEEVEVDESAHATDEPSLLTLAKKTLRYKSHMLEWHYRSQHQELITFSNEVFYSGRMKIAPNVIPFKRGNKPAIQWHNVNGYWEDRTNREEAQKVVERVRQHLSQENPPTVGVITFNAPQKELILDLIDELRASDPEFDELMQEDQKRPIDSQLFVKNIENVQGDERQVIIFSVAYARSEPGGRVNQLFGSLNAKKGENRLNVAVTRAIKRIEVVSSIDPERDLNVSMSVNAGPKILRNYLRFAHAVAAEDFDRVELLLSEINPNLQARSNGGSNVIESPFEAEVLHELKRMGYDVHTQVGQSGFRIDMAIVHPSDPSRYLLGIECDGAMFHSGISVRERDVFRQRFLEDRGWTIHRIWSTCWWDNKDKELRRLKAAVEIAAKKAA